MHHDRGGTAGAGRPHPGAIDAWAQQLEPGLAFQGRSGLDIDDRELEIGHGNHCAVSTAVLHDYDGVREKTFDRQGGWLYNPSRQTIESMPNIAAVLKDEIARIARKEARAQTAEFKKASAQYRTHIAALRRRIEDLERQVKRTSKAVAKGGAAPEEDDGDAQTTNRRFSATRLAAQRQKLGLSAADFATLIGVSGQSVYKWEHGEARPRARQLEAIAALRGIGKREAAARLAQIQGQ
ncbi:helix-turn-helix domain-containing protein [Ramlibacter sp. AN1133]|uniref:helix-turn-helix domain-containing protein n=1 Tax=Ramlibacter sp. AN1133 TaxID=3133429 RepID=UPI0030C20497